MADCEHDIVADATGVGYLCRRCGYEPDYELSDYSDADDATFRAVADRIEAAPEAAEAFDAVAALRRVKLVMERLDRVERDDEPMPPHEAAWSDGYVAASHVAAEYLRGILDDSDPFWSAR